MILPNDHLKNFNLDYNFFTGRSRESICAFLVLRPFMPCNFILPNDLDFEVGFFQKSLTLTRALEPA